MRRLLGFIGAAGGGWLGWYIGLPASLVAAFIASMAGTGFGMWLGYRAAVRFF